MIRARLQIDDGAIQDTFDAYGLIYLSADNVFAAPTKGYAKSSYAEQAGENVDPRTVDDSFDYSAKFIVEAYNKNLMGVNAKIKEFNKLMYTKRTDSDIKTFKTFTFYNDLKRDKIVGIPQPIAEVGEDDFFRDKHGNIKDAVVVELKLRVTNPNLCEYNTYTDGETLTAKNLAHEWYGINSHNGELYHSTSGWATWSLKTPVTNGAVVSVTTNWTQMEGIPYAIIIDDNNKVLKTYYSDNDADINTTLSGVIGGTLIVQCRRPGLDTFKVVVEPTVTPTSDIKEL